MKWLFNLCVFPGKRASISSDSSDEEDQNQNSNAHKQLQIQNTRKVAASKAHPAEAPKIQIPLNTGKDMCKYNSVKIKLLFILPNYVLITAPNSYEEFRKTKPGRIFFSFQFIFFYYHTISHRWT